MKVERKKFKDEIEEKKIKRWKEKNDNEWKKDNKNERGKKKV